MQKAWVSQCGLGGGRVCGKPPLILQQKTRAPLFSPYCSRSIKSIKRHSKGLIPSKIPQEEKIFRCVEHSKCVPH